ncbi:transposase [Mariniflexile jejuense]|uniref:Transposase n=1 Tax=Mariniflexile jejuense TaxID=1173582 RepID=A0ABW3JK09_9FLAO
MKKRYYSPELKEQAVRLSYQRENIKELADELGLEVQRIYKWRKAAKTTISPKPEKAIPDDTLEVKRLRKALREKELELEILKKAVHIFSKNDGKSMDL